MTSSLKSVIYLYIITSFILSSCSFFDKPHIQIDSNLWSKKNFYFADLDDNYKRTNDFNRIWSRLFSDRYRPYYKFLDKKYNIIGTYSTFKKDYLVIENQRGVRFKMPFPLLENENNIIPSYIIFE